MLDRAAQIKQFRSWTEIADTLIALARELDEMCPTRELAARKSFVYGGLVALNASHGWDAVFQPEDIENTVLWMFVELFIR
jgi:hypothetical protein